PRAPPGARRGPGAGPSSDPRAAPRPRASPAMHPPCGKGCAGRGCAPRPDPGCPRLAWPRPLAPSAGAAPLLCLPGALWHDRRVESPAEFLARWHYTGLFLVILAEEGGIPLPVPGDLFIAAMGFLAHQGGASFVPTAAVVT